MRFIADFDNCRHSKAARCLPGGLGSGMISVVDCDPRYDNVRELSDLPRFILDEISNFFQNYKVLQGVHVTTGDYHSKEETLTVIEECRQRYIDSLK